MGRAEAHDVIVYCAKAGKDVAAPAGPAAAPALAAAPSGGASAPLAPDDVAAKLPEGARRMYESAMGAASNKPPPGFENVGEL